MTERTEPRFIVTYLTEDESEMWTEDYDYIPPAVGNGVIDEQGKRWRIIDVWSVHEKRGRLEYGLYAFVEPATGDSDRPGRIAPEYYGSAH